MTKARAVAQRHRQMIKAQRLQRHRTRARQPQPQAGMLRPLLLQLLRLMIKAALRLPEMHRQLTGNQRATPLRRQPQRLRRTRAPRRIGPSAANQ